MTIAHAYMANWKGGGACTDGLYYNPGMHASRKLKPEKASKLFEHIRLPLYFTMSFRTKINMFEQCVHVHEKSNREY